MVGGVVVAGEHPGLSDRMGVLQTAVGAIAGPFDAYRALRGVKTLTLRMRPRGRELRADLDAAPQRI